jgi:hypothetical protein
VCPDPRFHPPAEAAPGEPEFPARDKDAATSTLPTLDADAAALLADIESFDMEAARRRVQKLDSRYTGLGMVRKDLTGKPVDSMFPRIEEAAEAAFEASAEPATKPAEAEMPLPGLLAGGLLDELRGEVASRQRQAGADSQRIEQVREGMGRCLRLVFGYFHDLTTQLNYLKPRVSRDYLFMDSDDAFRNLSWVEGHTDFRTQEERNGGCIERVTLGYTLRGPGVRTLERVGGGVERLRQVLFDLGMKFECQERRNRQRELEGALFTVADEIGVKVMWRADFDNNEIVLESRNLERLGFATFTFKPEAICPALLDEFGALMLGRPNRFRALALR